MKKKFSLALPLFILGSIAASYIIYVAGKESYRGRKIEKEVEQYRQELENIKIENKSLQEKIFWLDSDEFREITAKGKLNLKKEDEQVVEIRPTANFESIDSLETVDQDTETTTEELKNYMKWWNQFFKWQKN